MAGNPIFTMNNNAKTQDAMARLDELCDRLEKKHGIKLHIRDKAYRTGAIVLLIETGHWLLDEAEKGHDPDLLPKLMKKLNEIPFWM